VSPRAFHQFLGAFGLLIVLPGCLQRPSVPATQTASPAAAPLFADAAARAGIHFTLSNGATGKFYYLEELPAGCAFLDYDNDGWLDIFLVQSGPSEPPSQVKDRPHCALYHNNGNGTFTEVTAGSGLDRDLGYAHGVAIGDYDNDGYDDLFLTAYGHNFLFHNQKGSGKFTDVTGPMGLDKVHSAGYATSAAFGDYDNDGRLDLYVCYYSPWTWQTDKTCYGALHQREYCTPEAYETDTHQLFHNEGRRFIDVSAKAGLTKAKGRGLAVTFWDYDGDGRQDIFVANDISENMLWHNNGNGTFANRALQAGVARGEDGRRMAAMGIGIADYDHSGRESLFVTNFSGMPNALFKNLGQGLFEDVSAFSGVGPAHMKLLSFGCEFLDYDADGWPDLITANGHVTLHVADQGGGITYKEPKQLLHNAGNGTFTEITAPAQLGDLALPTVARGLAVGDYDNDGRLDVLITNQNDPAQLFRNQDRSPHHWVSFKTIGTKSNRDGLHARFTLTAGGVRQVATVRAGSSYLSHSDTRVYFGLGAATQIDKVEIVWPSGRRDTLKRLAPDRFYTVTEERGITRQQPPGAK
jgi:hypothetical protein